MEKMGTEKIGGKRLIKEKDGGIEKKRWERKEKDWKLYNLEIRAVEEAGGVTLCVRVGNSLNPLMPIRLHSLLLKIRRVVGRRMTARGVSDEWDNLNAFH